MVGVGEGILGSCTEKTSAPDEANPAGACLSVRSRSAPSSGSHAHSPPNPNPHVEVKDVRNPQNFQKNLYSYSPHYAEIGGKLKYIDDPC